MFTKKHQMWFSSLFLKTQTEDAMHPLFYLSVNGKKLAKKVRPLLSQKRFKLPFLIFPKTHFSGRVFYFYNFLSKLTLDNFNFSCYNITRKQDAHLTYKTLEKKKGKHYNEK